MQLSGRQAKHLRVSECALRIGDWRWPLAERHGADIALNWQRVRARNQAFFNGTVYLFKDYVIEAERLSGTLFKTDFQTMLYWRALPFAESDNVREAVGASLIRSAEGHLLFGRQAPGQLNSGRIYPPSGVIDADDVVGEAIDIDAHIVRELGEETGLSAADLKRQPGYIVAVIGVQVAIGVEWRSPLPAVELRERILSVLHHQQAPELDDIVVVKGGQDLADDRMLPHARAFARAVFDSQTV